MMSKTAKAAPNSLQSKRAPKSQKGSAKAAASFVPAPVEVASAPTFSPTTKPSKVKQSAKKTDIFQVDAGIASGTSVAVISKHKSNGFEAKQMPEGSAWSALLHDLGTMSIMQLRAKYKGEANTHRNMLHRVKICGALVHPDFRSFPSFLRLVGPKPTRQATLDRIELLPENRTATEAMI